MKLLLKIFRLDFLPASPDLALLLLRVWVGLTMLLNHGLGKLTTYTEKAGGFPDPLGVGSQASMALAIVGEVLCAGLLVLGLFGRFAALGLAITMAVAFFIIHQAALSGENSGELAFIYLACFVALVISGPGCFSLDAMLSRSSARSR